MLHRDRRWTIKEVSPMEAVDQLRRFTWTICTGFLVRHEGRAVILLNDSTGVNGAQEYAAFKVGPSGETALEIAAHENGGVVRKWRQVESLTVSWMTNEVLLEVIMGLLGGGGCDLGEHKLTIEGSEKHGRPPCCA